ncbi:MAG: peptidyl-prolyl cis-trans isomerase [Candidatus Hydrogenedentes bacterium]|nr:peptidyl-prolyl cis-trans isomerase [Candidatus Hydrogenedentota bacterium]
MFSSAPRLTPFLHTLFAATLLCGASGCGMLADTDRIVIAKMDGKNITRGKLYDIIYEMPDNRRPNIRSRQDYLRVLNNYIDREIKIPLGQQLEEEGKISIPREVAREAYFNSILDEKEQKTQRHLWSIPVPESGEETELMQAFDLTAEALQFQKNVVDQGTDRLMEKLLGEQAVSYLAAEAYNAKTLNLNEEALRLEYEIRKETLKTLESLTILGLQFPTTQANASTEAARVRERLAAGEDFDTILNQYLAKSMSYGIESVIENNPDLERFRGFWQEASGAKVGDIRGPLYMPAYGRMKRDEQGEVIEAIVPECYLVFKVLEHVPEAVMPFEQALPSILPVVAFAAMMEQLRDEHGVEIYEDKLPSPSGGTSLMLK